MLITEITQKLTPYRARIIINSVILTTAISAESVTKARQLLQYLYGENSVLSISMTSK